MATDGTLEAKCDRSLKRIRRVTFYKNSHSHGRGSWRSVIEPQKDTTLTKLPHLYYQDMSSTQVQLVETRLRQASLTSSPPSYGDDESYELVAATPTKEPKPNPPAYDSVARADDAAASSSGPAFFCAGLQVTHAFHIDTRGLSFGCLPLPPRAGATPVYAVTRGGVVSNLAYESIRPERWSGSCALYPAGGNSPVSSTAYRWGPGRPPRIQLHDTERESHGQGEEIEMLPRSHGLLSSRTQVIRTPFGTFQWSYASYKERRELGAFSVLFMDEVATVALAGGKTERRLRRVAQLVRKDEFCKKAGGACSAGVGGRLMMNLSQWAVNEQDVEDVKVLIISSCFVMLKKEIDRMRASRIAVI